MAWLLKYHTLHDVHAFPVGLPHKLPQVLLRAQAGVHVEKVLDFIAVVAVVFFHPVLEHRAQPEGMAPSPLI